MKVTDLITQDKLRDTAKKGLNYPVLNAEKDYFLALALKAICDSSLKDRLVFKGGTALHHCYMPQYRFSEDLDFTSTDQNVTAEDVEEVFDPNPLFTIKRMFSSGHTTKIQKLQYVGVLDQPNYLKIDISNVKNLALPVIERTYKNIWDIDVRPKTMDIVEICAEKMSATSGRVRYRDFYDLYLIVNELGVKINEALKLFKTKEVSKPITKERVLKNWQRAKAYTQEDYINLTIKKKVSDTELEKFLKSLQFEDISK